MINCSSIRSVVPKNGSYYDKAKIIYHIVYTGYFYFNPVLSKSPKVILCIV